MDTGKLLLPSIAHELGVKIELSVPLNENISSIGFQYFWHESEPELTVIVMFEIVETVSLEFMNNVVLVPKFDPE